MLEKVLRKFFIKTKPERKTFTVIREDAELKEIARVKKGTLYMRRKSDGTFLSDSLIEKRAFRYTSESALKERERACVLILDACSLR